MSAAMEAKTQTAIRCWRCDKPLDGSDLEVGDFPEPGDGPMCEECSADYDWCDLCQKYQRREQSDHCRHIMHTAYGLAGCGSAEMRWEEQKSGVLLLFDLTENPERWTTEDERADEDEDLRYPMRLPERLLYLLGGNMSERWYANHSVAMGLANSFFGQEVRWDLPVIVPESVPEWRCGDNVIYHDYFTEERLDTLCCRVHDGRVAGVRWEDLAVGCAWLMSLKWAETNEAITETMAWCREWLERSREAGGVE